MNAVIADWQARSLERSRVRSDVPASELTTFGLGGKLAYVVEPTSIAALQELMALLQRRGEKYRILGNGSNLVVSDAGYPGVVIHLGREFAKDRRFLRSPRSGDLLNELADEDSDDGEWILALAGASLMGLSRRYSLQGLSGLEFAAGIPGSVGGAVKMNAGAHHSAMSDVVDRVFVIAKEGEITELDRESVRFQYRSTSIPGGAIVVACSIKMKHGDLQEVQARRSSCLEYRKRTQPLHLPSAGSVFRNPKEYTDELNSLKGQGVPHSPSAAKLLELAGLKGERYGGVMFSELHANWLVKVGEEARASDVTSLISLAQDRVFSQFNITLEPEILVW